METGLKDILPANLWMCPQMWMWIDNDDEKKHLRNLPVPCKKDPSYQFKHNV